MLTSRKPKNIKYHNQRLILALLRSREVMTAGELAEQAHLSVPTITKILAELQARGLVKSMGKGNSTEEGGKKPELFALNGAHRYVISITAGSERIKCALLDLTCKVLDKRSLPYTDGSSYESCMDDISALVLAACEAGKLEEKEICGIAIGFEGIVDAPRGILRFPIHNQAWGRDLPVKEDLQARLPGFAGITINNGSRFAGYAELSEHPEYASCRVVTISTGTSTGGCVLENGVLMQGANGFIGELGHITVRETEEKACACGNKGCFETAVSPDALCGYMQELEKAFPREKEPAADRSGSCDYEKILRLAAKGDACARKAVEKSIDYYSILIRNIMLLYDPHIIVIQGIYTLAGDFFLKRLQELVKQSPFFHIPQGLSIVFSGLDFDRAADLGGALYSVDRYFEGDQLFEEI